ncbi:MAG: diaminopimelate epimerase [Burkholderiaceae bacterium]
MRLRFTKMHGAGNDFVMLDGVRQRLSLTPAGLRALADRHRGVGADQILVVEADDQPGVDFRYRIFNADGGEVEQCGNGARCFVRFVREQGLTDKREITVRTAKGLIHPAELLDGRVRVDMGEPRFEPADVDFDSRGLASRREGRCQLWALPLPGGDRWLSVASMGNPHAMQWVDDLDHAPVHQEGPLIERHQRFARGVNASFMQLIGRDHVRLRVWERGVGETLACGTGACAAAVLGMVQERLAPVVKVQALGGELEIEWRGAAVMMTGDAVTVFEGEIDWPPAAGA